MHKPPVYGCKRAEPQGPNTHTYQPDSASVKNSEQVWVNPWQRVEAGARMPVGDWIWPAIWMLPKLREAYGLLGQQVEEILTSWNQG